MTPCVLGCDPGLSGGLACLALDGPRLDCRPMPARRAGRRREVDAGELAAALGRLHALDFDVRLAVVERVNARPGQGTASMFSFGQSYGVVLGVLAALGVPTELVTPQRWKAEVLAGTDRSKSAAIAYCRRRFPSAELVPPGRRVPHEGVAEALALAEFGRRLVLGEATAGRESA